MAKDTRPKVAALLTKRIRCALCGQLKPVLTSQRMHGDILCQECQVDSVSADMGDYRDVDDYTR